MLAGAVLFRDETQEPHGMRRPVSRAAWVGLAAAVVVTALLGVYVAKGLGGRKPAMRGVEPLVAVQTDGRSIDARITGGFPWVPLDSVERSGAGPRTTPRYELYAAAAEVEKDAKASPTPENRHALGVARLVVGDIDDAIALLRSVVRDAPSKAKPSSDLGAALLARGEMKGRPDDLIEALSVIEKALESEPTLREGLFNRAVALEKLHLDEQAETAWTDYLARGAEPGWADEARERIEKLRKARESSEWDPDRERIEAAVASGDAATVAEVVARRTQETRYWIQDGLLVSWARAANEGREAEAETALALARTLSAALFEATGDRMMPDVVAAVGTTSRRETLIRGYLAYASGVERYDRFETKAARPFFEEAESALDAAGNPLALFVSYAVARCQNYDEDRERATLRLTRVLPEAERRGYLALIAHVCWLRGLSEGNASRLGDSIVSYRTSLRLFERIHEEEHAAWVSALLAEDLGFLGDEPASQRHLMDALSRLPRVRAAWRRIGIFMHAALGAARIGFSDVAIRFEDAAVDIAGNRGDATDIADSLQRRASIATDLRRLDEARVDVEDAKAWAARATGAGDRSRLDAELRYTEGRLARLEKDPERAIALLSESIDYFSGRRFDVRLPELHLERGRASRARGEVASAERDLQAGIALLETHRADVLHGAQRVSYFDTAHALFDEIMSLEISRGRPDSALAALERGKTRDLLDRWQHAPRMEVETLPGEVPKGVAVIAYGILPDRLLVWAVSNGSRQFTEEAIRAEDLSELVREFREELESSKEEGPPEAAERLYDVLIHPVAARIAGVGTLVFVPDEILHAVPFAALADGKTSRFLVQDHPVVVAPSIALFLHATRSGSKHDRSTPLSILAVGDPAFDAAAFPSLPRLPAAADEAKRIARLYSEAVVLTGEEATRAVFLQEIGRQSVVHFAGHALTNDADLLRSRLLLAADPERDDSGALFAEELYDRTFGRVNLVVLAGCATASGRISRGEGPLSLARPFLAGGVPAVLATLWEIEDVPSAELLTMFHKGIVAGQAPEAALREAQIRMIESPDRALRAPTAWAGFTVAGGAFTRLRDAAKEG